MPDDNRNRPDPDALLQLLKKEEEKARKGRLKIFFGMCAGVGKTYDMLRAAHEAQSKGMDVIVGYVETHGRPETRQLLDGLNVLARKSIDYRGTALEEFDIDAVLARKPQLALVDELAHTNAPGSRHAKRYQDVIELLDNGINVYTTLNVQHLESRANTVAQITYSIVRETVPDSIFESADEVEIVDISPEDLLKRLDEGKVYTRERSEQAIQKFFRKGNLTALREMSLRLTAERVDRQLRDYMETQHIKGPWKSVQRLVVGISASVRSVELIRWARRLSYTIHASWVAVFVESSKKLNETQKLNLAKNIKLARELGAEVITTSDENVAAALIRVAHQQKATQILVSKSSSVLFYRKTLAEELIDRSGKLDVYVVGSEQDAEDGKRKIKLPEIQSGLPQYSVAAALVVLVALVCYPLTNLIGYNTVSFIILLTVSLLPLRLGPGPVLLAATLGALVWDFFFIPPIFTFSIAHVEDVLMVSMYFIIAIVTGVLSARVRARERAVRQREERATALYALTKDLSTAATQNDVIEAAVANVKKFFNAEVVVYLSDLDGDFSQTPHAASTMSTNPKELSVAAWVYWNEKKAGKYTDTLPFAEATYFPMSGPRYPLGVVGVKLNQTVPLNFDQETLLENFISQISSTIEREFLNEISKKSMILTESERLYKTLFDSVSHELRTPIAAIMNAAENLQQTSELELRGTLESEIYIAANRLNRLVENLLDMTRLENGLIRPSLDWCDTHDVINAVLQEMKELLEQSKVVTSIAEDIPLLKIDFRLIQQALVNLLHNAAIYTPANSEIFIHVRREETDCIITVGDNGPGLPPDSLKRIFDKFYRVPGSKAGGTGLGLSIARGFIEAHRGSILAENRPGGGLQFTIHLPMDWSAVPVVNTME